MLAQDDFGFDIERCIRGYRITRGPMFGFRLWRFLFEVLRSATDKRQAHVHTVGRFSYATIRAPSAILGELSETKVPGEPFTIAVEGNWRPYLPLPDDFVSILNLSWLFPRTVRFYTCQGVTEVQGPRGLLRRLKTGYRLTKDFAAYARLRNWDEKAASTPDAYIEAMQKLGFEITFRDHGAAQGQEAVTDLSVLRFFPCLLAMAIVDPSVYKTFAQLLQDYSNYFGSAFENSLMHLLIFVTTLMFLFCARHFYANWTLRVARLRIALCIGGWGTRGKSGTERLKAAFLARLGYSMVSKSTGCEAMFLHNHNYGELLEIPFFRPYEKATIWEQRDIVRIAAGLNASVFLWECMGLTPSYVNILQRQWMNDDLSTITNTYPDHEDLQGPAGYDVAQTIAEFVPVKGHVFTTEQQMRPILADKCRVARTSMCGIGWLESGLITDDIMDRFPYKEHPDNIALVLAISDELNCERDFALKAMADDMVPDLGVLKTYPLAHVRTRKLEFTNGMSANERFGCLGNWSRLSFDQLDVNSDTWVSTVVNNRADRVARSRVFASILVNDISADRHFIIGSNLKGLQGFISENWDTYVAGVTLWSEDENDKTTPEEAFMTLVDRFRQPPDVKYIQNTIKTMVDAAAKKLPDGATPPDTEQLVEYWSDSNRMEADLKSTELDESLVMAILKHLKDLQTAWQEVCDFKESIAEAKTDSQKTELKEKLRTLLRVWFDRKLVVIEDFEATGEQIIHTICEETPVGYRNRIMGLQNIKGTGLDFVYRWLAWDACRSACHLLASSDPLTAERGLETLSATPVFGQLCDEYLRETFAQVSGSPVAQGDKFQLETDGVIAKLERSAASIQTGESTTTKKRNRSKEAWDWVIAVMEEFIDINDAVRRRKKADEIYRDLTAERIGRHRAVDELHVLNKRQKGAWLAGSIAKSMKKRQERKSLNRRVKPRAAKRERRKRPAQFR